MIYLQLLPGIHVSFLSLVSFCPVYNVFVSVRPRVFAYVCEGNFKKRKNESRRTETVCVCVHEKECLDVQIDQGMHCRVFSAASSVDTEEKRIHFSA